MTNSKVSRSVLRDRFKLLVLQAEGQRYEDLFVEIMTQADKNFKPVKAYGNLGDGGNDGWNSVDGRYYQTYAPDDLPKNTPKAIKKAKDDIKKLVKHWNSISPVRKYFFVVNDKFKGVSKHITSTLTEIRNDHNLESAEVIYASNLERELFSLDEDVIGHILGAHQIQSSITDEEEYSRFLVDKVTKNLHLNNWINISENLIASSIQDTLIDDFSELILMVFRTEFPCLNVGLELSVIELAGRIEALISHFTKTDQAYLREDMVWWKQDMRWKGTMHDQDTYHQLADDSDRWKKHLYKLHINLVHALNLFAEQVRESVDQNYFMSQHFVLSDSNGTFNQLEGYEYIPDTFVDVE